MNIVMFLFALMLSNLFMGNIILAENRIHVSEFSKQSLSGWEEKSFDGETDYQLITRDKKNILNATSQKAASGLFKEINIDLNKTPYLNWSWNINNKLEGLDERSKAGDDYAARIYVVKKHDYFFWKTSAINYVWSSNQKELSHWDNAYTSQAKMIAIQGKDSKTKHWYHEKRNVKGDFKQLFGEDINSIDVIAIMTDTDNSALSAEAQYGELYFSAN